MKTKILDSNSELKKEANSTLNSKLHARYQSNLHYYFELLILLIAISAVVIFTVFFAADYLLKAYFINKVKNLS